nr:hypothetical protein [Roseobacter litoralis]
MDSADIEALADFISDRSAARFWKSIVHLAMNILLCLVAPPIDKSQWPRFGTRCHRSETTLRVKEPEIEMPLFQTIAIWMRLRR